MNRIALGVISLGAGAALVVAGAVGSLAYWQDSANTTAASFTTGTLVIEANPDGVWRLGSTVIDPATHRFVPGQTLSYTQTFDVTKTGTELYAVVEADLGDVTSADPAITPQLAVSGAGIAWSASANAWAISEPTQTTTATVTITLAWPFGTAAENVNNGAKTVSLAATSVTITQTAIDEHP